VLIFPVKMPYIYSAATAPGTANSNCFPFKESAFLLKSADPSLFKGQQAKIVIGNLLVAKCSASVWELR
jgi:hypothetical protein